MFSLPDLPYAEDALAPHISSKTMKLHHGKHHKTYVDKLNELLAHDPMADLALVDVVKRSHGDTATLAIFNNAAQSWNHDFFWKSMAPQGGGAPAGAVKRLIDNKFGDAKAFNKAFTETAAAHFGSGWVWLVLNGDALEIVTTHDADLPLVHGLVALVTCDLWEHAYYLDYQNRRPEFVGTFLDHLINWDFANANLATTNCAENA